MGPLREQMWTFPPGPGPPWPTHPLATPSICALRPPTCPVCRAAVPPTHPQMHCNSWLGAQGRQGGEPVLPAGLIPRHLVNERLHATCPTRLFRRSRAAFVGAQLPTHTTPHRAQPTTYMGVQGRRGGSRLPRRPNPPPGRCCTPMCPARLSRTSRAACLCTEVPVRDTQSRSHESDGRAGPPRGEPAFPAGLIPHLVNERLRTEPPYTPLNRSDVEHTAVQPPVQPSAYTLSRIDRLMAELQARPLG